MCGIADGLGIGEGAAVDIGPGGSRDRGGAKEGAAVVDADGFTAEQGSGECASD